MNKSLTSSQKAGGKKSNKEKGKSQRQEPPVDYTDFRNNPILKPAPLDNPQDNAISGQEMGHSMATASKMQNLRPKDDKREKVVEFGVDMRNMNDTVTESEIARNSTAKDTDEVVVSFKPSNLTNDAEDPDTLDMSFGRGGTNDDKAKYASTILKEQDQTHDSSREANGFEYNQK